MDGGFVANRLGDSARCDSSVCALKTSAAETDIYRLSIWLDPLCIPAYVSIASILVLLLQLVSVLLYWKYITRPPSSESDLNAGDIPAEASPNGFRALVFRQVTELGGPTIFSFRVARVILVIALCMVAMVTFSVEGEAGLRQDGYIVLDYQLDTLDHPPDTYESHGVTSPPPYGHRWQEWCICLTYVCFSPSWCRSFLMQQGPGLCFCFSRFWYFDQPELDSTYHASSERSPTRYLCSVRLPRPVALDDFHLASRGPGSRSKHFGPYSPAHPRRGGYTSYGSS